MALTKYKQKRKFSETPEPEGGKSGKSVLRFVVQKHAASHLHYDFRLEMEGVLKSWAVPKGPSMDPEVMRLAMMVEDHPFDYRTFEGVIPEGNYGAGSVIVWDEGTYASTETEGDKAAHDKNLRHQLHKGKVHFMLAGQKLKGEFVLIKSKGKGENAWLLKKVDDQFVSTKDITKEAASVISGKTVEEIGGRKLPVKKSIRKTARKAVKNSSVKKSPSKKSWQPKTKSVKRTSR